MSAPRQQTLHYYLNPGGLKEVTQRVGPSLVQSSSCVLLDFVFLISTKNLKCMFRAATPRDLFNEFQRGFVWYTRRTPATNVPIAQ